MASTSASTPTKSQYHHFIPRFILRNFAHPYEPPNHPSKGKRSAKRGKRRSKDGYFPDEPMLYAINLAEASAELIETPVARTFGLTDMYRDFTDASNQHYLEEQLSRLESNAGRIISTIRKSFEAGEPDVWITRADRDLLRKFLFIMKYRGSTAHKRFYHENAEGYSADDKEKLVEYMREKGFKRPVDVWYSNIKAMLELKMDPERKWMKKLQETVFPYDAQWFIAHTQMMYLALCTPSGQDDEFLLTDNAYSIHEGPNSFLIDPDTAEAKPTSYTEFHIFAVISPKLTMVLRSFLLPVVEEDSNESIRLWRESQFLLSAIQHNDPLSVNSVLEDLPITKARNSYTKRVDGRLKLLDGEDGSPRSYHKFCFRFFPVSTEHVNRINSIMLEQSHTSSKIVFNSQMAARNALEYYLGMPCEYEKAPNFKTFLEVPHDPRLMCLKKLEQAARQMGSDTKAVYQVQPVKRPKVSEEDAFETLGQILIENLPEEPSESMKLYMKLGGRAATMPKDLDQAAKMVNMRIKIDVWTQGLDESFRDKVRENLRELFCQLPPRRVWYYLKRIRHMLLRDRIMLGPQPVPDHLEGPEDVIVNGKHQFYDTFTSSSHFLTSQHISHLFHTTQDLCRLMHFATLNHVHLLRNPDIDLTAKITPNEDGAIRLMRIKSLAFDSSGSICECAIPAVEEKARLHREWARQTGFRGDDRNPFWTREENTEMAVRIMVRRNFSDLLSKSLSVPDLKAFENVFFGFVYPSIGWK